MTTLLAFLLTIGVLVTIHEYGHYLVARLCGVKVLQFSIGFGPKLASIRVGRDRTEFQLAAIPLGGFVRMLDEREAPVAEHEAARAFNRQSVWKRIAVVSAGPLANLLLAVLLYWVLFVSGVTGLKPILGEVAADSAAARASMRAGELIQKVGEAPVQTWQDVRWALLQQSLETSQVEVVGLSGSELHVHQLDLSGLIQDRPDQDVLDQLGLSAYRPAIEPRVGEVLAGGVAARAGLQVGDRILAVDGVEIAQWENFVNIVRRSPEKPLAVEVERAGRQLALTITPELVREGEARIGRIGAATRFDPAQMDELLVEVSYGPFAALWQAAAKTWETSLFSLKMLGSMLTGAMSWEGVSGPVTIASYAGQSAQVGWKAFVSFLALISISLGVLNLLPVPVLDGGHLMYYMVEIFKGSPVSERAMEIGQKIGLLLLGLLMAAALYNDFNRLFTG